MIRPCALAKALSIEESCTANGLARSRPALESATRTGAPWPEAFIRSLGTAIKDEEDLAHLRPRLPLFIPGLAA